MGLWTTVTAHKDTGLLGSIPIGQSGLEYAITYLARFLPTATTPNFAHWQEERQGPVLN